ncbi:MAG: PRC-barrel domain containing protein, partial [Chloroflexi bacterium]
MLKGKQVIENPINADSSGKLIGRVKDVLIDPYSNQLGAFILKKRLSRASAAVLP